MKSLLSKNMLMSMLRIQAGVPHRDVEQFLPSIKSCNNTGVLLVESTIVYLARQSIIQIWHANSIWKSLRWIRLIVNSSCLHEELSISNVPVVSIGYRKMKVVIIWHVDVSTSFAIFVEENISIASALDMISRMWMLRRNNLQDSSKTIMTK